MSPPPPKPLDWALYDNNFGFVKSYPNCAKTFKFIDIFLDIKRIISQFMNHMKYISIKKPREYFINEKIQLSLCWMHFTRYETTNSCKTSCSIKQCETTC